ncbi:MAG: GDP-mannose 4,6-dehydratase [Gemmatimonadales bacterium]
MRVLVTGADGFVGRWLVADLVEHGHHVTGGIRVGGGPPRDLPKAICNRVDWTEFDLLSSESVERIAKTKGLQAVVHLAAVASGVDARQDPGYAWAVNAAGTVRLLEDLARAHPGPTAPRVVLVSTGEVYGSGPDRPLREDDSTAPASPYAASKLGAEIGGFEVGRRTGLPVLVARAFPHTGPGQSQKYVLPALASRLQTARRIAAPVIKTGNLSPVRDYLDARDVASAYRALIERGTVGEVYNVASGTGRQLEAVVRQMAEMLELRVILEPDQALLRPNDLLHLVGDATRLRRDTGWAPSIPFEQTLKDLLDAQAD